MCVRIASAILKIVFCHILFILFLFFNAVSALTSGGFRIVSDTLVIIIIIILQKKGVMQTNKLADVQPRHSFMKL